MAKGITRKGRVNRSQQVQTASHRPSQDKRATQPDSVVRGEQSQDGSK
jgi:hypothetical protein